MTFLGYCALALGLLGVGLFTLGVTLICSGWGNPSKKIYDQELLARGTCLVILAIGCWSIVSTLVIAHLLSLH